MFSVDFLIGLSLSIHDKKGERDLDENLWESCLFCLRGVEIVFLKGRVSLLLFLYLCFILFICLSFHTCIYVFVECFRKDRYILIQTVYLLLATSWLWVLDWDLYCNWAFYCIGLFLYLSISFCMKVLSRITKGRDC